MGFSPTLCQMTQGGRKCGAQLDAGFCLRSRENRNSDKFKCQPQPPYAPKLAYSDHAYMIESIRAVGLEPE